MSYKFGAVIVETRNIENIDKIIKNHTKFLSNEWEVIHIKNIQINDIRDYNNLLTSKSFWLNIPYDNILIFQSDSMLLRNGIEEFLEYDYVGAPWKFQNHGGNGGLSLRNKNAMIDILNKYPYNGYQNEDVYFSNVLNVMNKYKLAPREVCMKFSCETIFQLGTLGEHAIDKYLTEEECKLIRNQYK
jgi:hypothetical protein